MAQRPHGIDPLAHYSSRALPQIVVRPTAMRFPAATVSVEGLLSLSPPSLGLVPVGGKDSSGALQVGAARPPRIHAHPLRVNPVKRVIDLRMELHPVMLSSATPRKKVACPPAPLPLLHPSRCPDSGTAQIPTHQIPCASCTPGAPSDRGTAELPTC